MKWLLRAMLIERLSTLPDPALAVVVAVAVGAIAWFFFAFSGIEMS